MENDKAIEWHINHSILVSLLLLMSYKAVSWNHMTKSEKRALALRTHTHTHNHADTWVLCEMSMVQVEYVVLLYPYVIHEYSHVIYSRFSLNHNDFFFLWTKQNSNWSYFSWMQLNFAIQIESCFIFMNILKSHNSCINCESIF